MKAQVRYFFSWILANVLIALGFVRKAKQRLQKGDYILSIYFHKPSKEEFESCIKWLKKNSFTFLNVSELEQIAYHDRPFPKGGVIITIDDGWQSNLENIVEVARLYKVPIALFIATEAVEEGTYWWPYVYEARKKGINIPSVNHLKTVPNDERVSTINSIKAEISLPRQAMTIEELKIISMYDIVTIGSHTNSHPILPNLLKEQVYEEVKLSKHKLETWLYKDISFFAYPNGSYSLREIAVVKETNHKLAFTTEAIYLTPEVIKKSFQIPRFGFLENAPFAENICRIMGIWQPLMHKIYRLLSFRNSD